MNELRPQAAERIDFVDITATQPISPEALDVLAAHWLKIMGGDNDHQHNDAGMAATNIVSAELELGDREDLDDDKKSKVIWAMEKGVKAGIQIAAAVLGDPFGSPENAIRAALEELSDEARKMLPLSLVGHHQKKIA